MAEFIEREAFKAEVRRLSTHYLNEWDTLGVLAAVDRIPAADVRPVVLCRDCKHNMANIPNIQDGININENWNACQLTELYDRVKPDDFCSYGEKMEES